MATTKRSLRPIVLVGPSGVGKGTLIQKLMDDFPGRFGFSVSHTTRAPRPGEEDGVHYNFVQKADMEREIAAGKFLEYAHVHQNIYGTSLASVEKVAATGRVCILDIDVQGAEIVKKSKLNAVFVFISPPSMAELEKRLRGRGTETEESIQTRLANANKEMAKRNVRGFFDKVIVNDNLESAYTELRRVIDSKIIGSGKSQKATGGGVWYRMCGAVEAFTSSAEAAPYFAAVLCAGIVIGGMAAKYYK